MRADRYQGRRGIYELHDGRLVGPIVLKGADAQDRAPRWSRGMDSDDHDGARQQVLAWPRPRGVPRRDARRRRTRNRASERAQREGVTQAWPYRLHFGWPCGRERQKVTGVRDADNPKVLRTPSSARASSRGGRGEAARSRADPSTSAIFNRVSVSDVAMLTRQLADARRRRHPARRVATALIEQVEAPTRGRRSRSCAIA